MSLAAYNKDNSWLIGLIHLCRESYLSFRKGSRCHCIARVDAILVDTVNRYLIY